MANPSVSIIIPAYNAQKTIASCLQAVLHQDYPNILEVIVVDDGSTDRTPQIAKSFQQVKCFSQKNSGPATARNRGIREAGGELIAFTDADCLARPDWISLLVRNFSEPKVAVVAGSYGIVNKESSLAESIHREIRFRHLHLMPKFPKSFGSYNFCAGRNILVEVGGFDTGYRFASGEDNDLSYKVLKAGYKICFDPDAVVDHYHPEHVGGYLKGQFRHGFWRAKMYKDHPDMAKGDDYTFWKDMVEVPLAMISLSFLAGYFSHFFWLTLSGYGAFCLLFFVEFFYAFRVTEDFSYVPFWGSVTTLRAYARTFGFLLGLVEFFLPQASKKSK